MHLRWGKSLLSRLPSSNQTFRAFDNFLYLLLIRYEALNAVKVLAVPSAALKTQRGSQIVPAVLPDLQSAQLLHPQLAHQDIV